MCASSARVGSSAFDLRDCIVPHPPYRPFPPFPPFPPYVGGRSRQEIFGAQFIAGQFSDNAAAIEDERAVADPRDLLEVGGDDQDRRALAQAMLDRLELVFGGLGLMAAGILLPLGSTRRPQEVRTKGDQVERDSHEGWVNCGRLARGYGTVAPAR